MSRQVTLNGQNTIIGHPAAADLPMFTTSGATPKESCYFNTKGETPQGMAITFINGMANSFEEAFSNMEHIHNLSPNLCIEGVYNHSNHALLDAAEIAFLNYHGISPITGHLLTQKWIAFHEANKYNPHAKILHFCHSQGTIHTENALKKLPPGVGDRMIVVGIGPATIVTEDLCFRSYNYASKNDIVHLGQDLTAYFAGSFDETGNDRIEFMQNVAKIKEQLILLEPHENARGLDHEFQSPTFAGKIKEHLEDYNNRKGIYTQTT